MTDLEGARKRWLLEQPQYAQFGIALAQTLKEQILRRGIWADVKSRPKELDSLIRKLIRKPHCTYDALGDKVGVRVIVRYKDEVEPILQLARELFCLSGLENTADRLALDAVGYLSVHAVIKLNADDPRSAQFPPGRFFAELQVRTLAQNLWAEMAHDTVYKNNETLQPLPGASKRRIYILAGVVELADEEFNRIEREIPALPELDILKALERHYYKLTIRRGDPETSLDVIRLLTPLYKKESAAIIANLGEFYSSHEGVLRHAYGLAEDTPDRSAFLFQPEALMIYDLLECDQLSVRRVWNEHYPEKELERFANTFGISFD